MISFDLTSETLRIKFLATFDSSYILSFRWHCSRRKTKKFKNFNGFDVCMNSTSMRRFKQNGTKCAICGLNGDYAILCQENLEFRFYIFGMESGQLVQMTTDHIIPKATGGTSALSNLQTLCMPCNLLKANKTIKRSNKNFLERRKFLTKKQNNFDSFNLLN